MSLNSGLPVKFYGVSHVTASLTSRHAQLGMETFDEDGNKYVWMYNDCNSTLPPGYGVVLQSGVSTAFSMTLSSVTSADIVAGVVKHASIPTNNYGFVLTKGIGVAEALLTIATNVPIEITANGLWAHVSNTTGNLAPACGKSLEEIVTGASGSAYFSVY